MNLGSLTEFIVKNLVNDPDSISVKQIDDEDLITIEVLVSSDDMGKVIGKRGMIASSIRTIVQASSLLNNERRVKINIDSF
ncbi:MAG: KH domain-containing protein [Bacilli bacterium]|nr:KH domain-containing protein [Bacilli bacterium]